MVHKTELNEGASAKAIKKEVESEYSHMPNVFNSKRSKRYLRIIGKGLGVPQSTGVSQNATVFKDTPAANIGISSIAPEGNSNINNQSAGSDSAVGAAGHDGTMEVAGGAYVSSFWLFVMKGWPLIELWL